MSKNKNSKKSDSKRKFPRERNASFSPIDKLIESQVPAFSSYYLEEPKLVFHNGGCSVDPKAGLDEFGPFDLELAKRVIKIGIIGTGESIQAALNLLQSWQTRVSPGFNRKKAFDPILFPHFPGNTKETGFRCEFAARQNWTRTIPEIELKAALDKSSDREKLKSFIDILVRECEALATPEDVPDVVIITLPAVAEKEFGPAGNIKKDDFAPRKKKRIAKLKSHSPSPGQLLLPIVFQESETAEEQESEGYWNLHHALKARCMKFQFGTQIIWESTLNGKGVTQDPASIAWNLSAAIYYKAGNVPWQVQALPENVCFVGISFFKENPNSSADMQTSLAQVFGAGEGLVLKGEKAIVDKKRDRSPHLSESSAESILKRAIDQFTQSNGTNPKRVVVHKTSTFWPEEIKGFQKALGSIRFFDFVAFDNFTDIRFMRIGHKPPLRGTLIILAPKRYLLYTTGFVPHFRAYPGPKIPRPIEIIEHIGDSPATDICREILALTKLNWNSAAFANSSPITISFARSVGRILTEVTLKEDSNLKTKYRYFM